MSRIRWKHPNGKSMVAAMQCQGSLVAAVVEAGGTAEAVGLDKLEKMTALELLVMLAPNGIRFHRPVASVEDGE